MKNNKAIKKFMSDTVHTFDSICLLSRRIILASMIAMFAVQLSGCILLLMVNIFRDTYTVSTIYSLRALAEGLFDSGFRLLVLGCGSALLSDIILRSYGTE